MALSKSTITGRVPLPTDENLQFAELTFALSGLDTEGASVLPGGISTRIGLIGSDIPAGFELWQNVAGLRGTHYRVLARWTVKDRDGVREQYADLGIIQVGSDPSYTLADLINNGVPPAIGTFWSAITQSQYDAVIQAAADALASATAAALYDGPWLDTVAALIADTSLTYTTALPGTVVAGDYVQTRAEGFSYQVAASGASDHDETTAGGVKLYSVRKGSGGRFTHASISNPITGPGANLLIRKPNAGATRVHIEPNGRISSGVASKLDLMLDPYDADSTNYRIGNLYTQTGDANGTGESGIFYIGTKNVGNFWGNWTSLHFGFSDDSVAGVPMKMYLLDHTMTQHYTPHKGAWLAGRTVAIGDYVNALVAGVGRLYVAASAGICGATVPDHISGTVSDGTVSWTFVRQYSSGNVQPVVVFGDRDDMPLLGNPSVRVQFHAPTLTKYGTQHRYAAADGTVGAYMQTAQTGGTEDWFYVTMRSGSYIRYHLDDKYYQPVSMARAATVVTAGALDTTPSVVGVETLKFSNASPVTVTALAGGVGGQRVRLISTNSNTTIARSIGSSGGLIKNATGAAIVLTVDGAIDLERDSNSDFWRVVGVGY